jgi:hypothetical protein
MVNYRVNRLIEHHFAPAASLSARADDLSKQKHGLSIKQKTILHGAIKIRSPLAATGREASFTQP